MRLGFALVVCLLLCGSTLSQNENAAGNSASTPTKTEGTPTFRATSRLVLVDVVVTAKKGEFVRGLRATDFNVLEDGKLQHLTAFAEHLGSESPQAAPPIQLPPNQYTNYNAPPPDHAITIVLLDMMNTQFTDRMYARQQMLKFLRSMPTGQPIALFALSSNLRMIQGFTQSSDALIAAAKVTVDKDENAHLQTPASAMPLSQALQNEQSFQLDVRVRATLACLQALAQSVAGYPGRKNLIWLSGDFPIALGPEADTDPHLPSYLLYQQEVHETSSLLSSSQIAVYPIDVRGLGLPGGGSSTNSRTSTQFTMNEIAKETGGEAFYNQNDLKSLMQRSLDEGTNYYTLAYVPENHEWNGNFRKIEVKLATQGVKIRHRTGYYALANQSSDQNDAGRLLAAAMQPTVPESTRLIMRVLVLPPTAERKTVSIDFAVNPGDLSFENGDDQRKSTVVDFMAVALDKDLKQAALESNTVNANLRPETYQNVLKRGFPGHIDLEVKPGKYVLRLGAIDRNSEKIGTVDVPLDVPGETAKK
jgi:VWFA-related protein